VSKPQRLLSQQQCPKKPKNFQDLRVWIIYAVNVTLSITAKLCVDMAVVTQLYVILEDSTTRFGHC
jgi:hypothetical protein